MKQRDILQDLKNLLLHGVNTSQETIRMALETKGHSINQSKISRLLRKVNAIKSKDENGEMIYRLPHDVIPPSIETPLAELVIDVVANETTILIKTSPGSASLIARILDNTKHRILGTLAGDDTILVVPESVATIKETFSLICTFLDVQQIGA